MSRSDAQTLLSDCQSGTSAQITRTWVGYEGVEEFIVHIPVCPGGTFWGSNSGKDFEFTLSDDREVSIACPGKSTAPCVVTGTGIQQRAGHSCVYGSDCITGYCHFGMAPYGYCTCDPATEAGCTSPRECFSSQEIEEIQGITDYSPSCFLPVGSSCSQDWDCVTQSCVDGTCASSG